MNKNDLKNIIKEMVRESLTEIFVEMKLENIIENVLKKNNDHLMTEKIVVEKKESFRQQPDRRDLKESLKKKMGVSEDQWQNIYENVSTDRMSSAASTMTENPEFTSEDDLRKLGLL